MFLIILAGVLIYMFGCSVVSRRSIIGVTYYGHSYNAYGLSDPSTHAGPAVLLAYTALALSDRADRDELLQGAARPFLRRLTRCRIKRPGT